MASLAVILTVCCSCSKTGKGESTTDITLSGPDGPLPINAEFYPSPSDLPGYFEVIAHTVGKDVFTSLTFFLQAPEQVKAGSEITSGKVSFGAFLSSDSREYTDSFTGRMYLKSKSADSVTIFFDNVRFRILHGEYALNGNMVATSSN